MSTATAIAAEGELDAAYREFDRKLRIRYLTVADLVCLVFFPLGSLLEFFVYPDRVLDFLAIRLGVDLILLAFVLTLVFGKDRCNLFSVKVLGVLSALVVNFSMCLMIFLTEGAKSPYYAGLNTVFLIMATLLPWTFWETALVCAASLAAYFIACFAHPGFGTPDSLSIFASNLFFIILTTVICVTSTYFLTRGRFEDFRLRHQLDVQNQKLQDMDRLKTQFFSNVSHELRTPLTLILGPVETLLSRSDLLEGRVHDSLILIHRNTLRLLKLINDLLDLTRLDQGVDILRKKPIELGIFVKGVVESVRHLGLSKQLRMRVEDGDAGVAVIADSGRLEKVLINLLTNAIKYTPAGGAITVRWNGDAEGAAIEVSDTGVGIPPEDLGKVFDRFHQVRSNASNQNQGVGIGLALAKELVEQHGGTLEVESVVGKGTTFRIRLPAGVATEELPQITVDQDPEFASAEEPFEKAFRSADRSWSHTEGTDTELPMVGSGENVVLVADDENDMRRYIVSLLSEDYRIVQTPRGDNVSDLVAEHEPELVLLDWMMPGKDGLSVCRELRSDDSNRDLKIILLTARIDEKSKIDALQSGADDFLTKPFSSIEVKTRAANLLRAARLQRDLRTRNTELRETLEKLQRTETMLIQSEKMNAIGSLSAGLLHEINNPLNYTLTAISFAKQFKDSLGPEMMEIIADIEEGMVRIRDVITDLKHFAYPEKPGSETVFRLEEVFQAARKIIGKEIEDVRLDVDLPPSLVVRGQRTQLTHLFINLLSNAGKALAAHASNGIKTITVRATAEADDRVTIEVWDNGPGIPEDILNRVFEPFFTTREVGSGMGMGLSICHTIVESHQGSMRVANRPEGGAIFTINLPLAEEALKLC